MLHTDILRKHYSKVTVAIENQSKNVRKVHLVDQLGISRTYAVTQFRPSNWTKEITRVADEIKEGKSIGETFRDHGFVLHKRPISTHVVTLSERLRKRFSTTGTKG